MITLIVLLVVFIIAILGQKLFKKPIDFSLSGRIAMSTMLVFTAVGHFLYTEGMSLMLPDIVPFKKEVVLVTGLIELLAAVTLLLPRWQRITSILLIIFFLTILPANIYASLHHVNYQTATLDGQGPGYLWFRVPLQLLFIGWVWYFGLKDSSLKFMHERTSIKERV